MMLAIKEAASDMSPYVRKTAAHAIPKLYRYTPRPQPTPGLSQIFQAAFFFFFSLNSSDGLRKFGELMEMEDIGSSGSHLFMNRVGMRTGTGKAGDEGTSQYVLSQLGF